MSNLFTIRTGPAFGELSLVEQLDKAVAAHQCEAIQTCHPFHLPYGPNGTGRCESMMTRMHPTLNRRLCWTHMKAADNFNRSTPLRFVESK